MRLLIILLCLGMAGCKTLPLPQAPQSITCKWELAPDYASGMYMCICYSDKFSWLGELKDCECK